MATVRDAHFVRRDDHVPTPFLLRLPRDKLRRDHVFDKCFVAPKTQRSKRRAPGNEEEENKIDRKKIRKLELNIAH